MISAFSFILGISHVTDINSGCVPVGSALFDGKWGETSQMDERQSCHLTMSSALFRRTGQQCSVLRQEMEPCCSPE